MLKVAYLNDTEKWFKDRIDTAKELLNAEKR